MTQHRREFLSDVGQGMLVAGLGAALASDMGVTSLLADESESELTFGSLEPLVSLMQETPPGKLQQLLVDKIKAGEELKTLVAAGALANARSFAGQDYVGFHTIMAMMPAWQMSQRMPKGSEALPVLKVLYRNAERIQEHGGRSSEVLKPVQPAASSDKQGIPGGEQLRAAMRTGNMIETERVFYGIAQGDPAHAFNSLQHIVHDSTDVHRVVLAWRAWDVLQLAGREHAHTLLRQSVRLCTMREKGWIRDKQQPPRIRTVLPRMLDQYKLLSRKLGTRRGDDQWLVELSRTIFGGTRDQAAEAAAIALAEGYAPADVGEAISLAANQLVLYDHGRTKAIERKGHCERLAGSVHGDSVGVHASDAASAWRNIARVSNHRNTVASLITGAYHTAGQAGRVWEDPYPFVKQQETLRDLDATSLIRRTEEAINNQDQAMCAAAISTYSKKGHSSRPVFDLLLKYAVSEDGALHAEKYYQTVSEEFSRTRATQRWNHVIALARVTASEYGWPAPGHEEAQRLLRG